MVCSSSSGPGSGLFKSSDGGDTWKPLTKGLPTFEQDGLGRIGITVAPSMPSRMFATVNSTKGDGLFRSDDAGESWYRATTDVRVATRESDFAEVKVDPKNPDIVYTASVVTWKSVDGGKTFSALRGAPGGDDYHRIWINPINTNTMHATGSANFARPTCMYAPRTPTQAFAVTTPLVILLAWLVRSSSKTSCPGTIRSSAATPSICRTRTGASTMAAAAIVFPPATRHPPSLS